VYLVESSYDKHPSDQFFGKFGTWDTLGHINRNLQLITRLTDITGPVATLKKVSLTKKTTTNMFDLSIEYQFNGCLHFDRLDFYLSIDSDSIPTKLDLIKYSGLRFDASTEEYVLVYEKQDVKILKSLRFWVDYLCDK